MAQCFLETGQDIDVRTGRDVNGPSRRQSDLLQGRGVQVLTGGDPQHLAPCPRCDPGGKQAGCCCIQGVMAATCHLMQRAQRQSPVRQTTVNLGHAEGQHAPPASTLAFKTADLCSQRLQRGTGLGCGHGVGQSIRVFLAWNQ